MAGTPASAISSADSSSSYSASSMRVPVKTWAMPVPVLRRPWRRRCEPAAARRGVGAARLPGGTASAQRRPGARRSGAGATAALRRHRRWPVQALARGGGFFLKKLNMGSGRVAGGHARAEGGSL